MRTTERTVVYGLLCVALALGAGAWLDRAAGEGALAEEPPPAREPVAPKIATCDIYRVMQRLFESDRYAPARKTEHDKAENELKPQAEELQAVRQELATADPKDEKSQARARDYQTRVQAFRKRESDLERAYQVFMGKQFVECYGLARDKADAVAAKEGYSHVLSTRGRAEQIIADDPGSLMEQFLGRPVLVYPAEHDITEKVLVELHLPLTDDKPTEDPLKSPSLAPKP